MNKDVGLVKGDVVQLSPGGETADAFRGCLMVVTEPKRWGAQGYVLVPEADGPAAAYYRSTWADMEIVGRAVWVLGD